MVKQWSYVVTWGRSPASTHSCANICQWCVMSSSKWRISAFHLWTSQSPYLCHPWICPFPLCPYDPLFGCSYHPCLLSFLFLAGSHQFCQYPWHWDLCERGYPRTQLWESTSFLLEGTKPPADALLHGSQGIKMHRQMLLQCIWSFRDDHGSFVLITDDFLRAILCLIFVEVGLPVLHGGTEISFLCQEISVKVGYVATSVIWSGSLDWIHGVTNAKTRNLNSWKSITQPEYKLRRVRKLLRQGPVCLQETKWNGTAPKEESIHQNYTWGSDLQL